MPTGPGLRGWRHRWADRRNEEARRSFDAATAAWAHGDREARRMLAAARSFRGHRGGQAGVPVPLYAGEVGYLVLPGVTLVESRTDVALPPPGAADFPAFARPAGPPFAGTVLDTGVAVVTDRRIVLCGHHAREWWYDRLLGLGHLADGRTTLMRVSDRAGVSGLAADPAAARALRFNVALALADVAGRRAWFTALLERQIADHQRHRPLPPPVVAPHQATLTALTRPPLAAAAAAAVLLLCAAIGLLAPAPRSETPGTPAAAAAGASAPPAATPPTPPAMVPAPAVAASSPSPATTPARAAAPAPPSPSARATRTRTAQPPRRPSAPPKPLSLCGAPANPYGYNYCGRGSLVYRPRPDICDYFSCIGNFRNGIGYMIECNDAMVSMSGGRQGSCSLHGGSRQPVYGG